MGRIGGLCVYRRNYGSWRVNSCKIFSYLGILSSNTSSILVLIIACMTLFWTASTQRVGVFQALAIVCLAVVCTWRHSLNCRWAMAGGFIFRSATVGSGII